MSLNKKVSLFVGAKNSTPKKTISIKEVLLSIKNGDKYGLREHIRTLREYLKQGEKEKYDRGKERLHGVTFSGLFKPTRANQNIVPEAYTQIMALDLDKQKDDLATTIEQAKEIPYSFSIFKSPSGNGCKILVLVDAVYQDHTFVYRQVSQYYEKQLGVPFDSTSDLSRLCFLSHDPEIYVNVNSKSFKPQPAMTIQEIIRYTERKRQFSSGNRNNFIYLLACNLNRSGHKMESAILELQGTYTSAEFDEEEIARTVRSAYRNVKQHGVDKKKIYSSQPNTDAQLRSQQIKECLNELSENYGLSPCETSILEILLASELEESSVGLALLTNGFSLYQSQMPQSAESVILQGVLSADVTDFDQFLEEQTAEIRARHDECLGSSQRFESLPDIISRIIITKFKVDHLRKTYHEAFAISHHVIQADAEHYINQLQLLERYQKSWSEELSELVEEYMVHHRN